MGQSRTDATNTAIRKRAGNIVREMRRRSKKKGFDPPEFTLEDIVKVLAEEKCAVTKKGFSVENNTKYTKDPFNASPDRIDNSKGYTKENTRFVCWYINNIRGVYELKDFKKWIKGVKW